MNKQTDTERTIICHDSFTTIHTVEDLIEKGYVVEVYKTIVHGAIAYKITYWF